MITPKEKILDRVEQSFMIFKDHIVSLTLPLFILNFVFFGIVPMLASFIFLSYIPFSELAVSGNIATSIDVSYMISLGLALGFTLLIVYIFVSIPVNLGIMRSIIQAYKGEEVTVKENILSYGVKNIFSAFKIYWYIFAYIFLIPALIFIVGGILFNATFFAELPEVIRWIGGALMIIATIHAIVFLIYRGARSMFAFARAVEQDNYGKESLDRSVETTKGKWGRVFWNVYGVAIIASLATSLISNLAQSIAIFGGNWESIDQLPDDSTGELAYALETLASFDIFTLIAGGIETVLTTMVGVFVSIFVYVLYRRYELEFDGKVEISVKESQKEL